MKRALIAILTVGLVGIASVGAAETKIGYVDLQAALNTSKAGQQAKEKIGQRVQEYEEQIAGMQEELQKLKDGLEKQSVLLSDEARAEKERSYQQKLKDFQRFTKDAQEELQQKDADFTRKILGDLLEVVSEYGKEQGYTLILEETESSLLYADESIDITDAVIDRFNGRFGKSQ